MKITGSQDLTGKAAQIKEWVSSKGPVSSCFSVYDDFFSYRSGIYRHVTGSLAGEALTWRSSAITTIRATGIRENSWGTGWGDHGFFAIAYGECAIDTWSNHGVEGIENTGWQSNRRVLGLWTINEDRNAYAYFNAIGWRKISADNDNIFLDMLTQLAAAKAAGRPVNFYEEGGLIKRFTSSRMKGAGSWLNRNRRWDWMDPPHPARARAVGRRHRARRPRVERPKGLPRVTVAVVAARPAAFRAQAPRCRRWPVSAISRRRFNRRQAWARVRA